MQAYEFKDKQDAIYCRYCVGYLDDVELVHFLARCKQALNNPTQR